MPTQVHYNVMVGSGSGIFTIPGTVVSNERPWTLWTTRDTTSSSHSYEGQWQLWNTTSTVITTTIDARWYDNWPAVYGQPAGVYHAPPETAAERRARQAAARVRERELQRETRRRAREHAQAQTRARRLLLAHLTPEQRDEYERLYRFHVIAADGRRYRLNRGWAGNVQLVEETEEGAFLTEQLCIHPIEQVPDEDNLLAQKLMLETDPATFRRIANISRLRRAA